MPVLNVISKVLARLLRLVLRVMGLILALVLVLVLLVFLFFWILLRLLTGRKPDVDVSAHFSRVRVFTHLGATSTRPSGTPPSESQTLPTPWMGSGRRPTDVQDVEARDLPPQKNSNN